MVIISFGQPSSELLSSACQHQIGNVTSHTETGQWAERRYGPIGGISPSFAKQQPSQPYFVIHLLEAKVVLISQVGQAVLLNLDMLLLLLGWYIALLLCVGSEQVGIHCVWQPQRAHVCTHLVA